MDDRPTPLETPLTADDVLDALCNEALARPVVAAPPSKPGLKKLSYTHEDCIDYIIANPGVSQNELAARYGYTPTWMSIATNSDVFQARLAARRAELIDPVLSASLNERFRALTVRSLEVLQEKLSKPVDAISDKFALEAAALGAKSLGLGVAAPAPPAAADHLASLAHRLLDLQGGPRRVPDILDVESKEISR